MFDLTSPVGFVSLLMITNGLLSVPFGVMASRSFCHDGKLSPTLAMWSGIAMHGHALLTFAVAWLDRGSIYHPNVFLMAVGAILLFGGAYVIYLGRKAYGDQKRVYGLKEDQLITAGIYKRSRNPQYFGYGLMFLGTTIATGSGLALIFVAVFAAMVHAGVTLVEEPHLHRIFGEPYRAYKRNAGRYFRIGNQKEKTHAR